VDELIQEFLVESNENLDRFDEDLVKLEGEPGSKELLSSIFRGIHSIKGACGFLGFQKLEKLAHAGESLLSKLRDGQLVLNAEIGSALLEAGDRIRQMLQAIGTTGSDGEDEFKELIERLKGLQEQVQAVTRDSARAAGAPPGKTASAPGPGVEVVPQRAEPNREKSDQQEAHPATEEQVEPKLAMAEAPASALEPHADDLRAAGQLPVSPAAGRVQKAAGSLPSSEEAHTKAPVSDSTIRVNVNLLDKLMNLVGELVLARNQILQFAGQQDDAGFLGTIQRLNQVTTELREGVMKTRMQPISRLFDKVPRVVRDVSMACGKQVRVETEGKETELDRTLLEAMNDPLTHLVRNAIDHGIERPEHRTAVGKPAEGVLRLRALHEGGQVTIEISDDGAGIDAERIRKKAVERGSVTAEQAARMGQQECLNLILLPGVSTAEKVTNVSGRGVGMDVVKTNIERVGGSIEIKTKVGGGTTFKVKLPLTLAIVPALIVRTAGTRFAIPQVNLVELVRTDAERGGIELVHDVPVYRLRGRLLPLIYLDRELKLGSGGGEGGRAALNIVILQIDSRQFGLVVDEVHDTEEIVVKPLSKHLKGIRAYAGATIMGDGRPALILDVLGLAQSASISSGAHESLGVEETNAAKQLGSEKRKFVLFAGPGGSRMALPLSALARLEELPASNVERSGKQWVAQYRGQILPLIRVSHALEERRTELQGVGVQTFPPSKPIQVLVLSEEGRLVGLVVDEILDIVEDTTEVQTAATRAGVLYSAVLAARVTELLDVPAILQAGEAYGSSEVLTAEAGH
jgi:two-component system, chemotaxis family, sensor kinase CheA